MPARSDNRADGGVDAVLPGHIQMDGVGTGADLGRRLLGRGKVDVTDGDRRTLTVIGLGKPLADAARRPGDQGRFSVQTPHVIRSPFSSNRCSCA